MKNLVSSSAVLLAALLSVPVAAQGRDTGAGIGRTDLGPIDLDVASGVKGATVGALGCAYLNGEIFISNRDDPAGTTTIHTVYAYDLAGNATRSWTQGVGNPGSAAQASAWGYRDGSTDGTNLFFGYEGGIECIDINGNAQPSYNSANGPQPMPAGGAPIFSVGFNNTHRAVAYDFNGNNGAGSFWTASFGSALVEIDGAGNVLNTFPNNGWSAYGLALDPVTGNLWCNSIPNGGTILGEIDPATGMPTGNVVFHESTGVAAQGGLSWIDSSAVKLGGGGQVLLVLNQGGPDNVVATRLHRWNSIVGYTELSLTAGTTGGVTPFTPSDVARRPLEIGQTMDLALAGTARVPDVGAMWMNFDAPALGLNSATPNGSIPAPFFPELNEFVAQDSFTVPAGPAFSFPMAVAFGTINIPSAGTPFVQGDVIRYQAVYLDLAVPLGNLPVMMTNQVFYDIQNPLSPPQGVDFVADGSNSFNATTTSGFFSINNGSAAESVTRVIVDWAGSSNPGQATMVFNTNQAGMADVFDAGNSTTAGCTGTYRNGSDAACGLVYGPSNTPATSACVVPGFFSGAIFTPGATSKFLEFNFTAFGPGKLFEWDTDTDGGVGIAGGDMLGMVCEYWTASGKHVKGELAQISATRSEAKL